MLNPEVQVNFYERFNYLSFLIQKDEVIEWQVAHGHLGQEIVLFKERLIGLLQVMDLLRIAQILVYLYTSSGKVNTYCVINGGSQKNETGFSVSMSNPNTWTLVYAKNWTVSHNSDGSKQINIRVWGNGNFSIGSYDTNKTVTLDKIPRYTSIRTWSVAEVGKTYVKLNWATADTVDWLCTYLNDSKSWTNITAEGGLNASSGSFVYVGMDSSGGTSIPSVSTLKPNTKYKIKLWVRRKDSKLGTYSSNIEFTTKSVASISNLNEGFSYNIGDDLNLTFENSSENKSWLAFYIKDESDNWEEILKTDEVIQANSYTWQLSK